MFCNLLPFFFAGFDNLNLTVNTDMATVVKAMAQPDSGLEIRDRMWLKITIPNAFIGKIRCTKLSFVAGSRCDRSILDWAELAISI